MTTRRNIFCLVFAFASIALLQASYSFSQDVELPKKGLCAHRGDQGVAPESTIPAFEAAVKAGAQQVEFDVQRTKDGKLVVIHDLWLDRTTTGKGNVKDATFDEIRSLDAGVKFDPKFAGLQVPTFEEVLDCFPRDVILNIHLKTGAGVAAETTQVVVAKGRVPQTLISFETKEELDQARAVCPTIKTNYVTGESGANLKKVVQDAIDWKCDFIQFMSYDQEDVEKLHSAGVSINFFGTDDPEKIRALLKDGIDFPLVDRFAEDWAAGDGYKEFGLELNKSNAEKVAE